MLINTIGFSLGFSDKSNHLLKVAALEKFIAYFPVNQIQASRCLYHWHKLRY